MVDLHDEDGRRYGDWSKKGLRKDSNELPEDPSGKAWYYQNFWIIVLLLAFWPVGIVLCWKSDWPLPAKIAASIFIAVCVCGFVWVQSQMGKGFGAI